MSAAATETDISHSDLDLEQIADLNIPLSPDIDIPAYINTHFPSEAQLSNNLPSFVTRIDSALQSLDAQLAELVREHRHDTEQNTVLLAETHQSVDDLYHTLNTLAEATDKAEKDIDSALAPAKPIFTALQNVIATSEALDNLCALDSAVEKLEAAATSGFQAAAADLSVFEKIRTSVEALPSDDSLRRLPQLRARAAVATESIRTMLFSDFRRCSDILSSPNVPKAKTDDATNRLRTMCLVTDAMGPPVRAELIGKYVRGRRNAFRAAFEMDSSGFAGVDRRFSWIRNELRQNWARLGGERVNKGWGLVFPDDWRVYRRVADGLVQELRHWTSQTLDAGADRDVAIMVSALSKAKEFELELERRFAIIGEKTVFVGVISECFGPWMGAYVQQEDEHLKLVMMELVREERWVCEDGTVLRSAVELFLVIKKSMGTCASLDIRQPLFSLHRIFSKHLSTYGATLVKHLPGIFGNALADSSRPSEYNRKIQRACAIINTAEYCSTTVEQLEETLRQTVQEAFAADIDFSSEREKFGTVSAKGIQSVVSLLNEDMESNLRKLSSLDWATWKEVGDTSTYIEGIRAKLSISTKNLSSLLSKHHFRFLLEKFAVSFISRYATHFYRCEQINNFGAQQILLDITAVKALLLSLPASVHASAPGTYIRSINRELGKIEALLKVILAPVDMSVDTYVALVPEGTAEDLQKVLEMKGLRRAESAPFVLEYSRQMGPSQRLKPLQDGNTRKDSKPVHDKQTGKTQKPSSQPATNPTPQDASTQASTAAGSVMNLFGRLGTSFKDAGLSDRLGQVSSQFESTTDRLKKEAVARGFRFG